MKRKMNAVVVAVGLMGVFTPMLRAEAPPETKLDHPYLYFRAGEVEKLRARFAEPPMSYYLKSLLRRAAANEKVGDHLWAYVLTGEAKYRQTCIAWAKEEADRKDFSEEWIGFQVQQMAIIYDALHAELDAGLRTKMKGYLERALDAHMKKMGGWLYNNPSNTVPAQAGTAGMAALALLWESPKAPEAAAATRQKLARFAPRCFSPDGGYIEGTLYWSFGGSFYLAYAYADRNTTGNDDLLTHERLAKQYRFAETMLGGDGQFMPFNDSQPWLSAWPVLYDLGKRHDNELMLWLSDRMAAIDAGVVEAPDVFVNHNYSPLVYLMTTQGDAGPKRKADRPFPGVPTLTYLERMQWGVMRSSGDYIPNLVVGVKGSQGPLSHHKQKDLGSFMLYAGGEMLLLDPGYFQGGANAHTLPLINGKGPGVTGSRIVEAWEREAWRVMAIDSAPAYGRNAKRVRRTLVMHGDKAVVVLDDIIAGDGAVRAEDAGPGWTPPPVGVDPRAIEATAQYQAAQKATLDPKTGMATVHGRYGDLALWTFGPTLDLAVEPRDFGRSWVYRNRARDEDLYAWHSLTGQYTLDTENPLVTVLMPFEKGQPPDPPKYRRAGGGIVVTLPDGAKVAFEMAGGKWVVRSPSEPQP